MAEKTPIAEIRRRFTCPGLSIEQPDSTVPCYRAGHKCRSTWEELKDEHGLHQRSFCGCCGEQYGSMGIPHQLLAEWQEAAAAAVPDAGDDTLRKAIASELHRHDYNSGARDENGELLTTNPYPSDYYYEAADVLLPLIREHTAESPPTQYAYDQACKALHKHRERADKAEAAIERVRDMHRPCRIFDECDHEHELTASGGLPDDVVEVEEVGLTCEDGFLYRICYECCTGGSNFQSEECVDHHTHSPDGVYCSTIHVLDKQLEVPADA